MIRFFIRTGLLLLANAVGLLVAALVLDGVDIDVFGFIFAIVIFTIAVAVMTPFAASKLRRSSSAFVTLIATLVSLIVTDFISDGLEIRGVGDWLVATVIVWIAVLIAPSPRRKD